MEQVLAGSFLDKLPARLIGDKAYDSDPLDQKLAADYDIEMIAPNRRKRSTDAGRTQTPPLPASLARGETFRLDAQLPPPRHPLGVPYRQLPRLRAAGLPSTPAQIFMRPLLVLNFIEKSPEHMHALAVYARLQALRLLARLESEDEGEHVTRLY